jgi:fibronectin type 3 domain-containing protein
VYRRDQKNEAVRIKSVPMNILSFQDTDVAAPHTYSYSVSAVDRFGHESAKSQEATAVLR